MTETEFNQLQESGKVRVAEKQTQANRNEGIPPFSLDEYQPILETLRRVKRVRTSAPTHTPKNLLEQLELVDNSGTYELHIWFDPTIGWKSVPLT